MVAQVDSCYVRTRTGRLWPRPLGYALFEGCPFTTKGRWFNPGIFGLTWLLRQLPALSRVDRPAYIFGTGRSGTTILGIVLSMHRRVGLPNEPKEVWAGLHPCEDLIDSYNGNLARYRLGTEDATPAIIRGAQCVFGGYLRLAESHRLVDKYPELIFRTEFVRAIFLNARLLFLLRGGVATCGSIRHWPERLGTEVGGETHDWWGADDRKWHLLVDQIVTEYVDLAAYIDEMDTLNQEARAAVEWIVTMREGLQLVADDPNGSLHIPYEALCADPRAWVDRLEIFLGLRHDQVFADYAAATLADPKREDVLELPDWLQPIFKATEIDLASHVSGADVSSDTDGTIS